jgi:hypothetical protein
MRCQYDDCDCDCVPLRDEVVAEVVAAVVDESVEVEVATGFSDVSKER